MVLRAVVFDVDDTLLDHRRAQRAGLDALLAVDGVVADEAAHERWGGLVDATFARYLAGELTFDEQRRVRVRAMTGHDLDDDEADRWVAASVAGFEAALTVFDDVEPALDRISRLPDVRLGAFSNVDGTFTRRKLGLVGLLDRFDVVLGVEDVGAPKPAPEPFWAMCRALGAEPAEALHVGDRWATDAVGAAAAGLTGVWLDRPGGGGPGRRPPPDQPRTRGIPVVRSLLELADLAGAPQ